MARGVYTVKIDNLSVAAGQDLFALYAGASRKLRIVGLALGQVTQTTIGALRFRLMRLPATVTPGSGGASATPQKTDPTDAAATFTARVGDTTQATTSGTASEQYGDVWNLVNGYPPTFYPPPVQAKCDLSEALVVSLDQAPGAAIIVNGTIWVEEQ